jgi:sugar-specific transcriptional regulator TrmB
MIRGARQFAYLVGWADLIRRLEPELEQAVRIKARVVVISCGDIDLDLATHYRHAFEEYVVCPKDSSINLVVDGAEVLVGETQPEDVCRAAWSRNRGLVRITEEYIRHEVFLHKIIGRLGSTAAQALRPAFTEGLEEVPHG